jgi:hypothetical protein
MISIVIVIFGFGLCLVLIGGIIAAIMVILGDRKQKNDE